MRDLAPLFDPKGVIVAGASSHPGKFGFVSLHNLLASGYEGGVYGTNLKGEEVLGVTRLAAHPQEAVFQPAAFEVVLEFFFLRLPAKIPRYQGFQRGTAPAIV